MNAANDGLTEVSFGGAPVDLETIFHAQYGRIARVIGGIIKDPARAEELAVDVFLKWERTPGAHGDGAEGWLYRTAVRIALNELRRKSLHSRYEGMIAFLTRGKPGSIPEEAYAAQQEEKRVRRVLSEMEPRQAELLLLRSNDFSYQEIAAALNLNPASIGTLLRRAMAAFKEEFIQRYGKEHYGTK